MRLPRVNARYRIEREKREKRGDANAAATTNARAVITLWFALGK